MPKEVKQGKLLREPPYSVDFEQALLASCMLDGGQDSLAKCIDLKITHNSFYIPAHIEIFKACVNLYKTGAPVNVLTVGEQLRLTNLLERVGGYAYLNQITDRIESPANLTYYAKNIKHLEIARNLVRFFLTGLEDAYRGIEDIDQFLESVEQHVLEINQGRVEVSAVPFEIPLNSAMTTVQKLLTNKGMVSGVSSGFRDLDGYTSGFHPGEMIVLAARPSMGKTALALNIAESVILGQKPVPTLFFSLEMSAEQLAMRMVCGHGEINMTKLRQGYVESGQKALLAKIGEEFKNAPFWIDESTNMTILEMRAKARRIHSQHPLGLIIIDYLQLIAGTDSKIQREQQIAEISRGVKGLAKELNIPVIVLSQLNRESEREGRQPRLSDLRESGAIEQDADLVLILSKTLDELKQKNEEVGLTDEISPDASRNLEGANVVIRDLIIAKQRNGPVGTIHLTYLKPYTRFENYTRERL